MQRPIPVLAFIVLSSFASAADPRGDYPDALPSTPAEELAKFHVPPGFEVQLVAAEPAIQKPINLTFDAAGRLWVTGSEMYPWPASVDATGAPIPDFAKAYADIANAFHVGDKTPPASNVAKDTVRVLSDFDETGHARKITVFADGLNIPSGVQPLPRKPGAKGDSVIVYSIPNIWLLTDTTGSGVADKREVLYGTAGFLDTHGGMSSFLYWIDGWIYGTHGFRNHSELHDKNGKVTVLDSGNTYRFRPDGSAFEIYTHGQTNPFGLTVDPLGNFYSADSHSKPVYMLLRGGYYEGIGKQHDGLGFAPRITDDDHGSTAIAGIAYYAAEQFPEEYRGDLFNGNVVTQKINRDKLEWHGSTPRAIRQPDFLTCDDPWFRPVQVKLGPDGALYIADFYNPIIGHYEFPLADPRRDHTHGRIWRIVWRGEKSVPVPPMPDLSGLAADGLVKKLADPNLIVRTLATNELVERGSQGRDEALQFAGRRGTDAQRAHALWVEERIYGGMSEAQIALHAGKMLEGDGPIAVTQAVRIVADRDVWGRNLQAVSGEALESDMINARRAAIEGFARHPSAEHLSQLLKLWSSTPLEDTELVHAIRVALGDQFLAPQDADGLKASNRWQSLKFENSGDALLRSGVFAYASKIATEKRDDAEKLADVSLGAKTPEAAEFLVGHLGRTNFATPRAGEYLRHAVLYLAPERLPVLAALLTPEGRAPARPTSTGEASPAKAAATEDQGRAGAHPSELPLAQRLALADNLTQAYRQRGLPLSDALTDWTQHTMLDALASSDDALLKRGVEAVRDVKLDAKLDPLAKIVRDDKRDGALRLAALEATANLPESRDLLVTVLGDPRHMILRKRAAELLAQGGHTDAVLAALPNAPQELMLSFLGALAKTDAGCIALLDTIEAGKASPRLLLNKAAAGPLTSRPQPLRDRAAALTKDLPPEDARLDAVIAERAAAFGKAQPDATHGAQVFQQNCAICHRFHNAGGNVGPALDGVAARGPARLIEDILDPNRNVDPAFRQAIIETTDGEFLMGANRGDQGNSLILADATGKDITVPKNRIKKQTASLLSLMPPVFETAIQPGDFNDLLAFLLSPAPAP